MTTNHDIVIYIYWIRLSNGPGHHLPLPAWAPDTCFHKLRAAALGAIVAVDMHQSRLRHLFGDSCFERVRVQL